VRRSETGGWPRFTPGQGRDTDSRFACRAAAERGRERRGGVPWRYAPRCLIGDRRAPAAAPAGHV